MEKSILTTSSKEISGSFFLPPPISSTENVKTLSDWLENTSKSCDTITNKIICVLRLYRSPDKNYVIYLALAKHSEEPDNRFDYLSTIGNSYKIPDANSVKITPDQIIQRIVLEFTTLLQTNTESIKNLKKAELVTISYDNYKFTKLLPK